MAPAFIRTYIPLGVAYLATWLLSLGITVTDEQQTALVGILGTIIAGAYYAAVRWLEQRFPWASKLLGSVQQPIAYAPSAEVASAAVLDEAPYLADHDPADEFVDLPDGDLGPDFEEASR